MRRAPYRLWILALVLLAGLWLGGAGLAQKSGGGIGGRGGFRSLPGPSAPRVYPSPAPSFPLPTPGYGGPSSYPYFPRPLVFPGFYGGGLDLAAGVILIALIGIGFAMVQGLRRAGDGDAGLEAETARLRLALLYSADLQQNLRKLAASADTGTTTGLAGLVDEVSTLLLRQQSAWRFGSYQTTKGGYRETEAQFDQWMTEDRSLYAETFHKFEGRLAEKVDYQPKAEPGGRYLLVSIVVAASLQLPHVPLPLRVQGVKQALLAVASTTPVTLLAAFVSWTPEASGEALTESELLAGWPQLELL